MATNKSDNDSHRPVTWEGIRQWITVIITIGSILIGVGYVQAQISQLDRQTAENTATLKTHEAMFTTLQVELGKINTKLEYITNWIDRENKK